MTHETELDLGPLSWVKGEIDQSLARAAQALASTTSDHDSGALSQAQFAQTHVHQVCGALSIVGLDGLSRFATALDQLLGEVARGERALDTATTAVATRALAAIGNYLEELVRGTPDQALRLYPLYSEIAAARDKTPPSPAELFFPDLTRRPPPRSRTTAAPPNDDAWQQQLRTLRGQFQRGLLQWLRQAIDPAGPETMRAACTGLEALQSNPAPAALWWAAQAFFEALAHGDLPADPQLKHVCAMLDKELRQLSEHGPGVPDTLMRELLYWISQAPVRSDHQQAVRDAWQLDALLPEAGATVSDVPLAPLLATLQAELIAAKARWDAFCAGEAVALQNFAAHVETLDTQARVLARPALERLLTGIDAFVGWLRTDPLRFQDAFAIEVATALLLTEVALDRGSPEAAFSAQVGDTLARLEALQRGEHVPSIEQSPTVEATRRGHEKQARIQVAREMLSNLAQIEQALDDYFRNQTKRPALAGLARPFKQIEGALALVGDTQAITLVRETAETVATLAVTEDAPQAGEFEALAQRLSALGFYFEAMQHGTASIDRFLSSGQERAPTPPPDPAEAEAAAVGTGVAPDEAAAPDAATAETIAPPPRPLAHEEGHPPTDLDLATEHTQAADAEPSTDVEPAVDGARPTDETPPVEAQLPCAQGPAVLDPGVEPALDRQSTTAPTTGHPEVVPTTTGTTTDESPPTAPEPASEAGFELLSFAQPSASPTPAVAAITEADEAAPDAELLAIFIEEAHEVLDAIAEQQAQARACGDDLAPLTNIRRSFHTLKGSGRMVGLTDLGEAAWHVEQTLNRWLQLDWKPSAALHDLIDDAHRIFSDWTRQIECGGPHAFDADTLIATAEHLRDSGTADERIEVSEEAFDAFLEDVTAHEAVSHPYDELDLLPEEISLDDFALLEDFATPTAETPTEPSAGVGQDIGSTADSTADASIDSSAASIDEKVDTTPVHEPLEALEIFETFEKFAAGERRAIHEANPFDPLPEASSDSLSDTPPSDEPLPTRAADAPPASAPASELTSTLAPDSAAAVDDAGRAADATEAPAAYGKTTPLRIGDREISPALLDLFLTEGHEQVARLHEEFGHLQRNPLRIPAQSALRGAHTLAGISGTAGVLALHHLARALEHAIERLRSVALAPPAAHRDVLCQSVQTIEAMLGEVAAGHLPLAVPELEEQLEHIGRVAQATATVTATAIESAHEAERPALAARHDTSASPTDVEPSPPVHDDLDEQLVPIFVDEGSELVRTLHATLRRWQADRDNAQHATSTARLLHTLKGSARMAGAMRLGESVHQLESRLESALKAGPPAPELLDELVGELVGGLDDVERSIAALSAPPVTGEPGEPPQTQAIAAATTAVDVGSGAATLRVRADTVDHFVNAAGEIGIARTRIEGELRTVRRSLLDLTENVIRLRNQLREVEIQAEMQMQSRIAQAESLHAEFDPLEMDRYTRLQELTRMMAESVGDVTTVQQNLLRNLDGAELALGGQARLSRDLQQSLMQVRMVPFDSLADRLHRIVRQSAKDLGKRVNLDLRGGRIEVDRSVLERMTAPLEHLLRNAIAHGIESPQARQQANKAAIGQLTISVRQEGNEIAITLADDGVGLDFTAIAEKARSKGLLAADEVADERRLTNLIFVPGFSTAVSLSTLSGRGVGMDVVKSETAAVGGRIDVQSTRGQGTEFRIYLPLTLAVTQALLVRSGSHTYAVPSSMITQVLELKADALDAIRAQGGTDWQGQHFAYRYLPHLLGDRHAQPELQRFNWLLLMHAGAQTLALHVDALRGNQEIIVKNAGPQLVRIVGISGATVLGDGQIVLILNPVALASRSLAAEPGTVDPHAPLDFEVDTEPVIHPPTVMVVDDSLTVRKITGRLLEREGYRVITAKDGTDALEKLLETVPDVILSDIEMPRMDGFDLVRNIRADERTQAVPVIMITSRLADKHRAYAMKIGANHYLGKPFDEAELLALLAHYTTVPAG